MSIRPRLSIGDVIRYEFEFSDGWVEERPVVVIHVIDLPDDHQLVYVMPITRAPRRSGDPVLPLKPEDQQRLGLDTTMPSYVVVSEINSFDTPGFDWQRVPLSDRWSYGRLGSAITDRIDRYLADHRRVSIRSRDEPEKDINLLIQRLYARRGETG